MAEIPPPPVFEIDLGEHGNRLVFTTPEELQKWNNDERNKWQWLNDENNPSMERVWNQHTQFHNQLNSYFNEWNQNRNRPTEVTRIFGNIKTTFDQRYKQRQILNSTSPAAEFISELKATRGSTVAAGAYAALIAARMPGGHEWRADFFEGVIEGFLHRREIDWTAKGHDQAFTKLRQQYDAEIARQETRFKELEERNRVLNEAFNAALNGKASALEKLHTDQASEFKNLVDGHAKKIESLERTYDQTLALQKPVKYWQAKESYHRSRAKWFGGGALGCAVVAGSGLAWLAHWALANLKPDENPKHWQVGVLVVGAFFAVWLVRVFVRLLFSHLHLATDAAERRMMILTYLAMSRQGTQFANEDKKLIIQHIFRAASDGLVKDDAAPPTIFELLTRK